MKSFVVFNSKNILSISILLIVNDNITLLFIVTEKKLMIDDLPNFLHLQMIKLLLTDLELRNH